MKVRYTTLEGDATTAYLDDEPFAENIYSGTHKHTDEPLRLRKDEEGNFFEIPIPELADHQKFTTKGYQLVCECGVATDDLSRHYNAVIKGEQMNEEVTCPECDEGCTPEELAQWEMCHDCENQLEFDEKD